MNPAVDGANRTENASDEQRRMVIEFLRSMSYILSSFANWKGKINEMCWYAYVYVCVIVRVGAKAHQWWWLSQDSPEINFEHAFYDQIVVLAGECIYVLKAHKYSGRL